MIDETKLKEAMNIAEKVWKFTTQQVKDTEFGSNPKDKFLLEDMVLAYAIAFSNHSLRKAGVISSSWDKVIEKALNAVFIAMQHMKILDEKSKEESNES